ncbi:MAG: hypothetical protein ACHQD6_01940 [Steroidobacterales bacterium]|jgi:hypothetical protein
MNARRRRSFDTAARHQALANWFALFVLLALGIVWPPADATGHRQTTLLCAADR